MKHILNVLQLRQEALLFNSKPFIIKTFLAISAAYIVGNAHPIAKDDMISVLFGLILTLEPVSIAGLRRGKEQFLATLIGAVTTAIIISVFGIHAITTGISVALTLYICLRINWRDMSPVALFTAIYMTQFIQMNEMGVPSVLLTLRLRIVALGLGIIIAVFFNFFFSLIQMKSLGDRRIVFLINSLLINMERIEKDIRNFDMETLRNSQYKLADVFNDIDASIGLFEDMQKENRRLRKVVGVSDKSIHSKMDIAKKLRMFCHYLFDTQHIINTYAQSFEKSENRTGFADALHDMHERLNTLLRVAKGNRKEHAMKMQQNWKATQNQFDRLEKNMESMNSALEQMQKSFESVEL